MSCFGINASRVAPIEQVSLSKYVPSAKSFVAAVFEDCSQCNSTRYTVQKTRSGYTIHITILCGSIIIPIRKAELSFGNLFKQIVYNDLHLRSRSKSRSSSSQTLGSVHFQRQRNVLVISINSIQQDTVKFDFITDVLFAFKQLAQVSTFSFNDKTVVEVVYDGLSQTQEYARYITEKILEFESKTKIAVYGMNVTEHTKASIEKHETKAHLPRRIIGYLSKKNIELLRRIYRDYDIQDAPLYVNTKFTLQNIGRFVSLINHYKKSHPDLVWNTIISSYRKAATPQISRFNPLLRVITQHANDELFMIPFGYSIHKHIVPITADEIFGGHIVLVVISHGCLYLVDSNCVFDHEIVALLQGIATSLNMRFIPALSAQGQTGFMQSCEGKHNANTCIDRGGYCQIWMLFMIEILLKNRDAIIQYPLTTIESIIQNAIEPVNKPKLLRKLIVDFYYSRLVRG